MKTPPILPNPFFQFLSASPTSSSTFLLVAFFHRQNGWFCHIWRYSTWSYGSTHWNPWHHSTRKTLLCVLCKKMWSLLRYDTLWFCTRYSDLVLHTHTQMHTYTEIHTAHTGNNRLTPLYKFILTAPAMCSYHLCTLHWINNLLISKIYFKEFHSVFAFQKLLSCRIHIPVE